MVSGSPPLLLMITAHPLLDASKPVLPSGSFHLEQATAILVFVKISKTFSCLRKPNFFKFLCVKINFSLDYMSTLTS